MDLELARAVWWDHWISMGIHPNTMEMRDPYLLCGVLFDLQFQEAAFRKRKTSLVAAGLTIVRALPMVIDGRNHDKEPSQTRTGKVQPENSET